MNETAQQRARDLSATEEFKDRATTTEKVEALFAELKSHSHIGLDQGHLKRLINEYVGYYHDDRTHIALAKGTPAGREARKNLGIDQRIISMPRLGGLHHRYDLSA
jgi:hypothetical protein